MKTKTWKTSPLGLLSCILLASLMTMASSGYAQETKTETYKIRSDGKDIPQITMATREISDRPSILQRLQSTLEANARAGRIRENQEILNELKRLAEQYTARPLSKIKVVNNGPGVLHIVKKDGSYMELEPSWSMDLPVGSTSDEMVARNGDCVVLMKHLANIPCEFFDVDDNKTFEISRTIGIESTLVRDRRGYHLEQKR